MNTLPVIVDTSALISLVSLTDSNHARALAVSAQVRASRRTLLVPGEVFTETVNTLGKKVGHEVAAAVGQRLQTSGEFAVVETTPALRIAAMAQFAALPGGVSLTDCFVMACAEQFATPDIFGFDGVFAQNGYQLPEAGEAA